MPVSKSMQEQYTPQQKSAKSDRRRNVAAESAALSMNLPTQPHKSSQSLHLLDDDRLLLNKLNALDAHISQKSMPSQTPVQTAPQVIPIPFPYPAPPVQQPPAQQDAQNHQNVNGKNNYDPLKLPTGNQMLDELAHVYKLR